MEVTASTGASLSRRGRDSNPQRPDRPQGFTVLCLTIRLPLQANKRASKLGLTDRKLLTLFVLPFICLYHNIMIYPKSSYFACNIRIL